MTPINTLGSIFNSSSHNRYLPSIRIGFTSLAALSALYFQQYEAQRQNRNTTYSEARANNNDSSSNNKDKKNSDDIDNNKKTSHYRIIETDFTDKLASKPYLTYHNIDSRHSILTSTINTTKQVWSKIARNDVNPVVPQERLIQETLDDYTAWTGGHNDISASSGGSGGVSAGAGGGSWSGSKPKGVPRRIRILAIDVPEFREVFDGECRVNFSRIYPDDIAPRKTIKRRNKYTGNNKVADENRNNNTINTHDDTPQKDSENNNNHNDKNTSNTTPPTSSKSTNQKPRPKQKYNNEEQKLQIIQKSLARSLVRCRNNQSKRIGVELLEASVYDLNPNNMRRTYQFGNFKYDPGKYRGSKKKGTGTNSSSTNGSSSSNNEDMIQRRMSVAGRTGDLKHAKSSSSGSSEESSKGDSTVKGDSSHNSDNDDADSDEAYGDVEETDHVDYANTIASQSSKKGRATVLATDDDEVDAPWNQYAWIEEMDIRIRGYIPFGANVERASFVSNLLFGRCYRRTVQASRSYVQWFIPSFLSGQKVGGEDGIDGDYGKNKRTINRASSKPHAVIADGAAMQRVPGSLRYLTKCCQEANVPLFIINDPRVWGGNTHSDLENAAKDMRKTIKARIIANALTIKEGSMFERGRFLGRLETEAKWQAKDVGRRTRQALTDAAARLKKEREDDFSKKEMTALKAKIEQDAIILNSQSEKLKHLEDDLMIVQSSDANCKSLIKKLRMSLLEIQEKSKDNDGSNDGSNADEIIQILESSCAAIDEELLSEKS